MFLREKGAALSILYTLYNLYTLHKGEKVRLPLHLFHNRCYGRCSREACTLWFMLHLFPYLLKREEGGPLFTLDSGTYKNFVNRSP